VEAPHLATVKDFLRFYAAMIKGKIKGKITSKSLNTFDEWFFTCFSRVRDTIEAPEDRKGQFNLRNL